MGITRGLMPYWSVVLLLALNIAPAGSSTNPLELVNIGAAGAGSRYSRAYPNIEYNVRAAVVGGAYPYTFSLANAPAGMVIDSRTGEIVWPKPQASASPTLTVVDSTGNRVSATWQIEVTTAGFKFVDAANGQSSAASGCTARCGTGTIENPWRTLADVYNGVTEPGQFLYLRAGAYSVADVPRSKRSVGTPWERVEFEEPQRPVVWLGYPGERPTLDFGQRAGGERTPLVRLVGRNIYVDNLETVNSQVIGFQAVSHGRGPTFRRLVMRRHGGRGLDGSNASMIMTVTSSSPARYMVIQDSQFQESATVAIKIYAQEKMLIENNVFRNSQAGIALKADVRQFTVRGNTFSGIDTVAIGGNMHETTTSGQILFNLVQSAGLALDLNQDGMAGPIDVYRNTLMARVQVRNADDADGPFTFRNNVIISDDRGAAKSHVVHIDVSAPSRVIVLDNLSGRPKDKIVDGTGALTPEYAKHRGLYGH